ncbi:Pex19 protein family-domain-containing protein [Coniella lustricola]|uniref:Pex19 protein family-domain-containing protein n=1 Tax=Coniella lustricola TaxID=2025994 RepID=A0A2T3A631_9PEZI|nr:Pex19 protein family-domain-containing protein [Coniella lustricola]
MSDTVPKPEAAEAPEAELKAVDDSTQDEEEEAEDFPDPDEDDLDDLDDMLDDFSTVKIDASKSAIPSEVPGQAASSAARDPSQPAADNEALSDDDFAKQLQAGMAELMGEIEGSPEMQAQFESIFKELSAVGAAGNGAGEAPTSSASGATPGVAQAVNSSARVTDESAETSFQDTIRRTMERMQNSGEQATAAAAADGSGDFMAELLKQMQAGEGGLEGSEEEFSKMLLGMMEQLTNKDILYEPMKELNDKFPEWMETNKDTISEEDRKRYELQQGFVKEIVAKFEEATYADSNPSDREYIVERMQKMQAAGSPPPDLVGDMPSAQDALGAPDMESCNPQ